MAKKKNNAWFVRTRGSYLPNSWQGWLLYVPYVALLVGSLLITLHYAHPFQYAAFQVGAEWIAITAAMTWIAGARAK